MKKILLLLVFTIGFMLREGNAQCTVTDLAVELKSATPVAGGCEVVFNFSWKQEVNNGNKFAYIHLWRLDQYPDLNGTGIAYTNPNDHPTAADLITAIGTIVINDNGSATPVIGKSYHPEPAVPVLENGLSIEKEAIDINWERVTVENITLIIPNCTGAGIKGDIWASQADNGKNVHCVSSGVSIVVGNPRVAGLLSCTVPRQYSIEIKNLGEASLDITYNIYVDEGDEIYEPSSHDQKVNTIPVGPITIGVGGIYISGLQSYLPYSSTKPYSDRGLWVEITETGQTHKTIYYLRNNCTPLPVTYISFSAQRIGAMVKLDWTTGSETYNQGFEIQRKMNGSDYYPVAFVPSLAVDGNSTVSLSYTYSDNNPVRAISEYRLMQKDVNGKTAYSEIRNVQGLDQDPGVIVYPNPSENGELFFVFAGIEGKKDIAILGYDGKLIRQWRAFEGTVLPVSQVYPGLYVVRVIVNAGTVYTTKFEVLK